MRSFLVALLATLAFGMFAAEPAHPMIQGAEGKKAFDDLGTYYANTATPPPYKQALADLAGADAGKKKSAGIYINALFQQLYADEFNGRAPVKKTPFFGGAGASSDAREFRRVLAAEFGKQAQSEAALDAVLWLIESEKDAKNQGAALDVIKRINGPKATEILKKLLDQPHPNGAVAKSVIELVAERGLKELAPSVTKLCGHYRTSVREAAIAAAPKLGIAKIPEYKAEAAFTPWLESQLKDVAAMGMVDIKDAQYVRFTLEDDGKGRELGGWKFEAKPGATKFSVMDWFGDIHWFDEKKKVTACKLNDDIARLLQIRNGGDISQLSRYGAGSSQFEPKFFSAPEAFVAAWSLAKGDKVGAATLLFPRLDQMADDRWMAWIARDMIAAGYHQQMLDAFTHERDYGKATSYAEHLSKSVFDDYTYQVRAKTLLAQLKLRGDDFKKLTLPDGAKWAEQKRTLNRDAQIKFLAERMRLLNCIQMGQPGDVDYAQPQTAGAMKDGKGTPVINPYVELRDMKLEPADLAALAPFIADENFVLAYSYWRDFHNKRTLHQANWIIAAVLNDAAKKDLADLGTYAMLDDAGKKKHIDKIVEWCKINAGKTRDQLVDERPKQQAGGMRIDAP